MGEDLAQAFASARAVFAEADNALGFSLSRLCFAGPEEELRRTINTQPAIMVVSYACLLAAREAGALPADVAPALVAGHSLGEYTALIAAGALSFSDALLLVRERARLMEEAGRIERGGMAAVLSMSAAALQEVCDEAGVEIANFNSQDQLVISGAVDAVAKAAALARERGARRVVTLEVGGAFHSRLMQPASEGIAKAIEGVALQDARVPVVANSTAEPITSAADIRAELIRQLCAPVRWQATIERMTAAGVDTFIEIGPGKVLAGLVKRIVPGAMIRNLGDLASLAVTGAPVGRG